MNEEIHQYTPEKWQDDIKSIARRTYIAEEMNRSASITELKDAVRLQEAGHDLENILDKLISGETVDPRMEKLCEELLPRLQKNHPYVEGIIILGSSSHGGGLIRSLADRQEEDLDWGIIYSPEKMQKAIDDNLFFNFPTELNLLADDADKEMKEIAQTIGMKGRIYSCILFNPSLCNSPTLTPYYVYEKLKTDPEDISFYIASTIPKELGMHNIDLIKEGLLKLKQEDPAAYLNASKKISELYSQRHVLKEKHFEDLRHDERSEKAITRVVSTSKDMMSTPIKNILDPEEENKI